jgi:hypothetical protein
VGAVAEVVVVDMFAVELDVVTVGMLRACGGVDVAEVLSLWVVVDRRWCAKFIQDGAPTRGEDQSLKVKHKAASILPVFPEWCLQTHHVAVLRSKLVVTDFHLQVFEYGMLLLELLSYFFHVLHR